MRGRGRGSQQSSKTSKMFLLTNIKSSSSSLHTQTKNRDGNSPWMTYRKQFFCASTISHSILKEKNNRTLHQNKLNRKKQDKYRRDAFHQKELVKRHPNKFSINQKIKWFGLPIRALCHKHHQKEEMEPIIYFKNRTAEQIVRDE